MERTASTRGRGNEAAVREDLGEWEGQLERRAKLHVREMSFVGKFGQLLTAPLEGFTSRFIDVLPYAGRKSTRPNSQ